MRKKAVVGLVCIALWMTGCSGGSGDATSGFDTSRKTTDASSQGDDALRVEAKYDAEYDCILAGDLSYKIVGEETATVLGNPQETATEIEIPDVLVYADKEYPITAIGDEAFSYLTELESITISGNVTKIGKEVFCGCSSLKEITIPDTVTSLGSGAFYDCDALEKCVIGKGVTALPKELFTNCYKLSDLQLPDTLVSVGAECLWSCEGLTEMVLPESTVSISERAFYGSGIVKLTIPAENISVTEDMLEGMDSLETIYVPEDLVDSYKEVVPYIGVRVKKMT